ncbi:MAG TPA: outer membrane lipoprotein carrier protein LolA [Candidatus Hydrogenedentes bacterium]|nr:outer membrane lipoprotein carrier protein LolA [Candidatus Hydrogenedentota bacterium]
MTRSVMKPTIDDSRKMVGSASLHPPYITTSLCRRMNSAMMRHAERTFPTAVMLGAWLLLIAHSAFSSETISDVAYDIWSKEQVRAFLAELEASHGDTTVMAAAFDQQKRLRMLREPLKAKGYIYFSAPGLLRFDIVHPFQSVLLYHNEAISRFEKDGDTWKSLDTRTVRVMSLVMGQIARWMQGRFEDSQVFQLGVTQAAEEAPVLHMTPVHDRFREFIARIDLIIGPPPERPIQRIIVREPNGDDTEIEFTQTWRGLTFPDELFQRPDFPPERVLPVGKENP